MTRIAIVFAALLIPATAFAQIYQWKDANGKVHYSDQPPPASVKQERTLTHRLGVTAGAPSSSSAPAPTQSIQDQESDFRERQVEREEARVSQEQEAGAAAERSRNCEAAQGNLRNLQVGGRTVRYDQKTGERVYMNEDELVQVQKDAQRAVDEWCKPQTAQR